MEPVALYDQMLDALHGGRYGPAAVAGTVLAVFSLRFAAARWWARAPWAWLRGVLRWCAGGPGGALLGGATALGVEVLAQAAGGPLTWWVLAGAVKTWLLAMGAWAGAKNLLPPVARGAARRKARLGPAAVAALLGLCLLGGTQAQASTRAMFEPPVSGAALDDGAPDFAQIVDLVPGIGLTCVFSRNSCELAFHLWGYVAIADVAPGWTLGPALGFGGTLPVPGAAGMAGVSGAISVGPGLQLPWGSTVRLGVLLTADYYAAGPLLGRWGISTTLGFFF